VIARAHHLQEEQLLDSYVAERTGDGIDPPTAEHLGDCAACGRRYADFCAFMDALRQEGLEEADEIFTAERLRVQEQQIARRIEQLGRPARVLSFPTQLRRTIGGSSTRTPPRWVAAAAAAGLFVGVAVGASYQWTGRSGRGARAVFARETASARLSPVATRGSSPAEIAADTAFLSDLEIAVERPHTQELQAFDALTPHFREIRDAR
jgi:anti-sigma factor RsiW